MLRAAGSASELLLLEHASPRCIVAPVRTPQVVVPGGSWWWLVASAEAIASRGWRVPRGRAYSSTRGAAWPVHGVWCVAKVNFLSITQNGRRMCARSEELQRGHHRRGV
jgi:hypothetical protein